MAYKKNCLFLQGSNNFEAAWTPCIKAFPGIVELGGWLLSVVRRNFIFVNLFDLTFHNFPHPKGRRLFPSKCKLSSYVP